MRWKTGPIEREGMYRYLHLVRAEGDPDSTSRENRAVPDYVAQWRRDLKKESLGHWRIRVVNLLRKLGPCTFQRLCVEAIDRDADTCYDTPIDAALWSLVEHEDVEHTMRTPILFKLRSPERFDLT
jgi:hypothetical protein